jgi:hypothetical protein
MTASKVARSNAYVCASATTKVTGTPACSARARGGDHRLRDVGAGASAPAAEAARDRDRGASRPAADVEHAAGRN